MLTPSLLGVNAQRLLSGIGSTPGPSLAGRGSRVGGSSSILSPKCQVRKGAPRLQNDGPSGERGMQGEGAAGERGNQASGSRVLQPPRPHSICRQMHQRSSRVVEGMCLHCIP